MKKMMQKKCFVVVGIITGIILLSLLLFPTKTQKLISSIKSNNCTTVKALLENGVDPNRTDVKPSKFLDFFETNAKRPLTVACEQGNLEIVQHLIDYGATAEKVEGTGWSPLRTTLFYYQPDDLQIIKLLIEHGANPNEEEEDVLPVFAAANMTPKVFDSQKTNGTVFCTDYDQKTAEGITEIVIFLLGDNSVNITNDSGQTLLMVAIQEENIYLTEHLMKLGCDINQQDTNGKTTLDYALVTKNSEIIELFEKIE